MNFVMMRLTGCASDPDANGWGAANHDKEIEFIASGPTPIDEVFADRLQLFAVLGLIFC